ncbi:MAG: DUF2062 domain-containing protein [Rhodobacteraceae bacterium]|nr:DUF2062 domain-containing protein [Paracoccaceae bacterium]
MVFRRRTRLTLPERLQALVYPKGGWRRAARYVWVRLTRLPDPPHRIARGIWAGIFVSFTPLFGVHLGLGAVLAFVLRGNVLAALLATMVGNPLSFPVIAVLSIQLGHLLLGNAASAPPAAHILQAFASAGAEVWNNLLAVFLPAKADWGSLASFYDGFFLPYMLGGLIIGGLAATAGYLVALPLIGAYQALRLRRRQERSAHLRHTASKSPGIGR